MPRSTCARWSWERHGDPVDADPAPTWSHVVTGALAVPALPPLGAAGALGERARLTANFRDQYYGLVPAVEDGGEGPPLVTSGLLDPGRCEWGRRPVRFAGRRMTRPTVHLDRLAPAMRRWAAGLLVPKVLVANQTRVVEAAVDAEGAWLPGVPVITARPLPGTDPWAVAAVLTSPVASAWAWHRAAGTGLSARAVRLGPRWLGELPWPAGTAGRRRRCAARWRRRRLRRSGHDRLRRRVVGRRPARLVVGRPARMSHGDLRAITSRRRCAARRRWSR